MNIKLTDTLYDLRLTAVEAIEQATTQGEIFESTGREFDQLFITAVQEIVRDMVSPNGEAK